MTTATPTLLDVRFGPGVRNYLNEDYGFFSWILTRRIADGPSQLVQ